MPSVGNPYRAVRNAGYRASSTAARKPATSSSMTAFLPIAWLAASMKPSLSCAILGHIIPGVSVRVIREFSTRLC